MAVQNKFKKSFLEKIKLLAKDSANLHLFAAEKFEYSNKDIVGMHGVEHPANLENLMINSSSDFEAALHLYKAYEHITPLTASDEAFWSYLALVELNGYAKKKLKSLADLKSTSVVLARYFAKERIIKNVIARIWWAVYMSEKGAKAGQDRFKLTEILFSHSELFDTLTQSRLFRYRHATMGILSFFHEHQKLITRENTLNAMKYFNRVGGARELVVLQESFFKKELEKKFANLIMS